MKHKVSELEGALLDAAVAKAEWGHCRLRDGASLGPFGTPYAHRFFVPSSDWAQAGPIIERERIALHDDGRGTWFGRSRRQDVAPRFIHDVATDRPTAVGGPTPLIAAMRAYVASKFGEEVELP